MRNLLRMTCGSFTVVMLLFMLLSPCHLAPDVSNRTTFQVFIMSASIASVMVIAERIKNESPFAEILIKAFICYTVVFFEGVFFKMTDFSWRGLLQLAPVLIPAFVFTYLLQYFTCVEWASHINASIKRKK